MNIDKKVKSRKKYIILLLCIIVCIICPFFIGIKTTSEISAEERKYNTLTEIQQDEKEYSIKYRYSLEDTVITECYVEITTLRYGVINTDDGWIAEGENIMKKTFTDNYTGDVTIEFIKVTETLTVPVNVNKIGDHIIELPDDNLYSAVKESIGTDKILEKDDEQNLLEITDENLKTITTLVIENKGVSDIAGISGFSYLLGLYMDSNNIENIEELTKFDVLPNISFSNNKISNIPEGLNIKRWDNGDSPGITLMNNNISDVTPLTDSIKKGIEPVNSKYGLMWLNLSKNHISDISSLEDIGVSRGQVDVKNQTIDIKTDKLTGIELPQIFIKAINDGKEITYNSCLLEQSGNTIAIDKSNMNNEISAIIGDANNYIIDITGSKFTITSVSIPVISLVDELTKDTYVKLNNESKIKLTLTTMNLTDENLNNITVKVKIGNDTVKEGTFTSIFENIGNQKYSLNLGDNDTSKLNGRVTIEVSEIDGGFEKTVLNTKYIIDNQSPNPDVLIADEDFKDGKARVSLILDEIINKLIEDGKEYNIKYHENGKLEFTQNAGGWERAETDNILKKYYETPGKRKIRVIDRAGNYKDIELDIRGWVSNIKLDSSAGTYKYGDKIKVVAEYLGDDILESTSKSVLKYSIGSGEVKSVEENVKDKNTITYIINVDKNDIGTLKFENISIRTNRVLTPDFSSINIDAVTPEAKVTYSTENLTNGNVVATITANEPIQEVTGWKLSTDKLKLTKEYTSNTSASGEKVTIKDLAGNTTEVNVKITNIDKEAPKATVSYSTTSSTTGSVVVTITSNEEIQEVSGWKLSTDKLKLTKTYTSNTTASGENITIKDMAGNTSVVNIKITNINTEKPTEEYFNLTQYKIKDKYIVKIEPNTKYSEFIKNIQTNMTYTIKEGSKVLDSTSIMKTGQVLTVGNNSYTIVVMGDLNGDGNISLVELARISKIGAGKITNVSEIEKTAIDINVDGKINIIDLASIAKKYASK